MAQLSAICMKCGAILQNGLHVEDAQVGIIGDVQFDCRCGGFGMVPRGLYSEAKGLVSFLADTRADQEQMLAVQAGLRAALKTPFTSKEELTKILAEHGVTDASLVASNAPADPSRFRDWLMIVLTIMFMLSTCERPHQEWPEVAKQAFPAKPPLRD